MDWKSTLIEHLARRVGEVEADLALLQEGLTSETKSTAGDKHETGRAMIQMEMDAAVGRLAEFRAMLAQARSIATAELPADRVVVGHCITTDRGAFILGPPVGKFARSDGATAFALSAASPLGKAFLGACIGEVLGVGNARYTIESLT